jgi:hypothetical protein
VGPIDGLYGEKYFCRKVRTRGGNGDILFGYGIGFWFRNINREIRKLNILLLCDLEEIGLITGFF